MNYIISCILLFLNYYLLAGLLVFVNLVIVGSIRLFAEPNSYLEAMGQVAQEDTTGTATPNTTGTATGGDHLVPNYCNHYSDCS